jgi:hypothetical protein
MPTGETADRPPVYSWRVLRLKERAMTFSVGFGWWLLPTMVTVVAFTIAVFMSRSDGSHGEFAAIGNAFVALVIYGMALIASLLAWLIWALAA